MPEQLYVFKNTMGWIEVIIGNMFSGKSKEIISRGKQAIREGRRVVVFNHKKDNRYSENHVVSHDDDKLESIKVTCAEEIIDYAIDAEVVIIDEGQFFDKKLVDVCRILANLGKRVIVAFLNSDYRAIPWNKINKLINIAEAVSNELAVCSSCGNPAVYSQRFSKNKSRELIGGQNEYAPMCRNCYTPTNTCEKSQKIVIDMIKSVKKIGDWSKIHEKAWNHILKCEKNNGCEEIKQLATSDKAATKIRSQ